MQESVEDADAALVLSSAAGDLEGRCLALDMVAAHASYFSQHERARALAREARALAERLGDPYHKARAVMRQSWGAGEFHAGRAWADEAIPLLRACGNLRGIIEMSAGLAAGALYEEEYEAAADAAEEGLCAAQELGEPMTLALTVGNAAIAQLFLGRMDVAERRLHEY